MRWDHCSWGIFGVHRPAVCARCILRLPGAGSGTPQAGFGGGGSLRNSFSLGLSSLPQVAGSVNISPPSQGFRGGGGHLQEGLVLRWPDWGRRGPFVFGHSGFACSREDTLPHPCGALSERRSCVRTVLILGSLIRCQMS